MEGYTDSTLADDLSSLLNEGRVGDAEAAIETLGREAGAGDKTILHLVHARAALFSILEKVKAAGPTPSHQALCRKAEKEIKELIDGITMAIERYHESMKR